MSKILHGVALLAGHTVRTSAYIQAMFNRGIRPENILLYGDPERSPIIDSDAISEGLFFHDPSITTLEALRMANWEWTQLETGSINDGIVIDAISDGGTNLIIYSGYGGELVGKEALSQGVPFLHVHAGLLPEFRGSTTIYYQLLERGDCSASAIILSSEIDCGDIVYRDTYPAPARGENIDYVYDPAIRADVLIGAIDEYVKLGGFGINIDQKKEKGRTYYVIHPILKHLTILGLKGS